MKHHVLHLGLLGVIAVACFFAHPLTGRAGDAKPDVLLVNMTPDEKSTERSRDCVQAVASRLRSVDGYTIVHRQGETPTREAAGMTADEPFMEWPAGAFGRLEELEFRSENGASDEAADGPPDRLPTGGAAPRHTHEPRDLTRGPGVGL